MFTTLVRWSGAEVPNDCAIDGAGQRALFEGNQESSNRDGFPSWMGANKGRLVGYSLLGPYQRVAPIELVCFVPEADLSVGRAKTSNSALA